MRVRREDVGGVGSVNEEVASGEWREEEKRNRIRSKVKSETFV
jgi:hypothetical protein